MLGELAALAHGLTALEELAQGSLPGEVVDLPLTETPGVHGLSGLPFGAVQPIIPHGSLQTAN